MHGETVKIVKHAISYSWNNIKVEDGAFGVHIMFKQLHNRISFDFRTMHWYMDNVTASYILSHSLDMQGLSHPRSSRTNNQSTVSAVWMDVYHTCKEKIRRGYLTWNIVPKLKIEIKSSSFYDTSSYIIVFNNFLHLSALQY